MSNSVSDGPGLHQCRILILVMATARQPWARYQQVQQQTWCATVPGDIQVLRYFKTGAIMPLAPHASAIREAMRFGRKGHLQRVGDHQLNWRARRMQPQTHVRADGDLEVSVPDFIHWNGVATIAALQWALQSCQFDFVLRVNSSAYVNPPALAEFITELDPHHEIYAGSIESGSKFWGFDFINGAAVLLSRRVVERVMTHSSQWDHRFTDDASLGLLARELGIRPISMPVLRISTDRELNELDAKRAREQVAIRFKSTEEPRLEEPRMLRVHELLMQADS